MNGVIMTSIWSMLLLKIINVFSFLILPNTLLFEYCLLWRKNCGIGFCQQIQENDFKGTANYAIVSIKLRLDVRNKEYIILCYCGGPIISGFDVNNHQHHHHKTSSSLTINYYYCYCYYYCCCCCCRWRCSLLGLLVLRKSISSLLQIKSETAYFITKCDGLLFQSATGTTKCDNFITKGYDYYKVRQNTVERNPRKAFVEGNRSQNLWRALCYS